jgi:hypothetical protein
LRYLFGIVTAAISPCIMHVAQLESRFSEI